MIRLLCRRGGNLFTHGVTGGFLFLKGLALEFKRRKLILSIHAPEFDITEKVVSVYNEVAEIYGSPITLTMHPHCKNWVDRLNNLVDRFKDITLCIENLDPLDGAYRPELCEIAYRIKDCDSRIRLCLDIGHEINLTKRSLEIDSLTAERISNVHIHGTFLNMGKLVNHGPLESFEQIILLEELGYNGSVVYEVALDYMNFKLKNYRYALERLKMYASIPRPKTLE